MFHKGDVCTYIPSQRTVVVQNDQTFGDKVLVTESDVGNPSRLKAQFTVPPSDLRRRPDGRLS